MENPWVGKVKSKVAGWLRGPFRGPPEPLASPEPVPKASWPSGAKGSQPNPSRGRGAKKDPPHRIDEFHPRGAAGRREVHAWKGARKHALPQRGNRSKNPK